MVCLYLTHDPNTTTTYIYADVDYVDYETIASGSDTLADEQLQLIDEAMLRAFAEKQREVERERHTRPRTPRPQDAAKVGSGSGDKERPSQPHGAYG